jgi:hypothetical protein
MPRTSLLLGLNLRRPHVTRHRWLQTKTEYPGVSDSCDVPARVWALVTYLGERKTSGTQVGAQHSCLAEGAADAESHDNATRS